MTIKKGTLTDLMILEKLPAVVDLRLLASQFSHYKQPRKKIFDLTRNGYLEMITNGHYLNPKSESFKQTPLEAIANAISFPSYVSSEWALQHYGLLMEQVQGITSVTPGKKKTFKTSLGIFVFEHVHKHRYAFGYGADPEHGFLIARPEKALLDFLKLREHLMELPPFEKLGFFFEEHLRVDVPSLLRQTGPENIRELLPHYHRNAKETRVLKWLLEKY